MDGEGEITKDTRRDTAGHEARLGQSQRTQRPQRVARAGPRRTGWTAKGDHQGHKGGHRGARSMAGTHLGSAGGEGGRERSAGEARRATGGARKPPAPHCVFAVPSWIARGETADCADWGGLGVGCRRQDCQKERRRAARPPRPSFTSFRSFTSFPLKGHEGLPDLHPRTSPS